MNILVWLMITVIVTVRYIHSWVLRTTLLFTIPYIIQNAEYETFYVNSVYTVYIILVDFNLHLQNNEGFSHLLQVDAICCSFKYIKNVILLLKAIINFPLHFCYLWYHICYLCYHITWWLYEGDIKSHNLGLILLLLCINYVTLDKLLDLSKFSSSIKWRK